MHKVTKDTPHGTVELRAENVDALAYVIKSVTMRYDMAAALRAIVIACETYADARSADPLADPFMQGFAAAHKKLGAWAAGALAKTTGE